MGYLTAAKICCTVALGIIRGTYRDLIIVCTAGLCGYKRLPYHTYIYQPSGTLDY
jgi:hypothetical protein